MDANKMLAKMIKEFEDSGIPIPAGKICPYVGNLQSTHAFGRCVKKPDDTFQILLNDCIRDDEDQMRKTIAHELVHTCPGCFNHGNSFKHVALMVQIRLGIVVTRTSKIKEGSSMDISRRMKAKYKITCTKCGTVSYRTRACALTKDPDKFQCSKCRGKLHVAPYSYAKEMMENEKSVKNVSKNDSATDSKDTLLQKEKQQNKEKELFELYCRQYGFRPEDYGKVFLENGKRYKFIGFNPKARTRTCIAKQLISGERYIFSNDFMKRALGLLSQSDEETKSKELFRMLAAAYGFKPADYGKVFPGADGNRYKLIGFRPKARKNVCRISCLRTGTEYCCEPDFLVH